VVEIPLTGLQDAKRAYDMGYNAIYLSNHGGRALDGYVPSCRSILPANTSKSSPPALYTLLEINKFHPEIIRDPRCEIYIDGGIRRGTDVVKALCLGATGVGMGRPFMYALTYGEEGVRHAIDSESLAWRDGGVADAIR
jgi:L-lactate dehydrogenase (cytochrome)